MRRPRKGTRRARSNTRITVTVLLDACPPIAIVRKSTLRWPRTTKVLSANGHWRHRPEGTSAMPDCLLKISVYKAAEANSVADEWVQVTPHVVYETRPPVGPCSANGGCDCPPDNETATDESAREPQE